MRIIFPYGKIRGYLYPMIDLTLKVRRNSLKIKALLDSGASFSVLRAEIAEYFDIDIEQGKKVYLEGISGRILGYIHYVYIIIGEKKFRSKVVFTREITIDINLVGRDNFFKHFLITFDENNKRTILKS